jgi:hypothetical protein
MTPGPHSLSKLALLLLPLLLTPTLGLAATQEEPLPEQEASSEAPESEEEEAAEEESVSPEEDTPVQQGWRKRSPLGLRLGAEAGLGLLMGSWIIVPGAVVGGIIGCSTIVLCIAGIIVGAELGYSVGVIAGVYGAGTALGADGQILPVVLGTVAGLIGSFVLLSQHLQYLQPVPLILDAALPPLVGAMLGYELFVSPEPQALGMSLGRTRIQPVLSVSPWGTFVGLGGRF